MFSIMAGLLALSTDSFTVLIFSNKFSPKVSISGVNVVQSVETNCLKNNVD